MTRTRSWLASATAVAVTAAGLTLATPAQPALASTSLSVTPRAPIVGESFAATGRVSTRFVRPVALKAYSAGAWRTVKAGRTNKYGRYRLTAPGVRKATAYKVVAAAYRGRGQTASGTRTVRPVAQTSSISVLPQVVQAGASVASAGSAKNSVLARFVPARPGRSVTFQRFLGGHWISSPATTQRADGTAIYRGSLGGPIRAVAAARYGAASIFTSQVANDWALKFSDEFGGQTLNRANWDYRAEGQYITSRTRSKSDSTAVSVGGGTVNLMVKPDPRSGSKYLNGHISTERHYKFTHGVAAARVKFQRGRGAHGSFWLQSPTYGSHPGNPGLSGAEIDTVEFFGQGYPDGGLATFLYYANSSRKNVKYGDVWPNAYKLKAASDTWWNSYHVFAVKWTPTSYTFYIDGQQLWSSAKAVSRTGQFLILSLLSSDWELKYLDRANLATKSVMRVDWARVWQR